MNSDLIQKLRLAIENIRESRQHLDGTPVSDDVDDAIEEAISALESMRWIPVSERLPETANEDYLVLVLDQADGTWPGDVDIAKWYHASFIVASYEDVTHWMPMPATPKVE